jgi:hypothetical protein
MKGDQNESLWEVKIPIKGRISIEQDGKGLDDITFHLDKDGISARTVVEGSQDEMEYKAIERVNMALDKIAFETGASIRIEKSGMKANRVSAPSGRTTREVIDSKLLWTIKVIHPIDEDTLSDADKCGSNIQDDDKKLIFQRSLSYYRNGLNAESDGNPNAFLDFWNAIEVITSKYGKGKYLFSWDNIPGKDSERLLRYLIDRLGIKWVKDAKIRKSDDGKIIYISKDESSAKILINEKKATLTITYRETYNLTVKKESGKRNIYAKTKTKDEICDCFEKCCGDRKEDEVAELYRIRNEAAHGGLKNLGNPKYVKTIIEKTPQMKKITEKFLSSWSKNYNQL